MMLAYHGLMIVLLVSHTASTHMIDESYLRLKNGKRF